ncbi:uncharacterized protein LOC129957463 [Argiope bruennichi]|uniref:uncharacterized protein LOC129957463 n=1 Tax=Argiope bruennichi TaxID=94029 RepID=UPI0024955ECC|nr:uncharacterized protein LOC129957463 [Argiope bruennichi]
MDQKSLFPSVSYINEAFLIENDRKVTTELFGVAAEKTDFLDSKSKPTVTADKTHKTKPEPSSCPSQIHKLTQTGKSHITKSSNRSKANCQRFRKSHVVRHVACINESSEMRECLSFVCVLILGAAGVGVFLALMKFAASSTVTTALTVIGSCMLLVFIFICITTLLRNGTSLHRR